MKAERDVLGGDRRLADLLVVDVGGVPETGSESILKSALLAASTNSRDSPLFSTLSLPAYCW